MEPDVSKAEMSVWEDPRRDILFVKLTAWDTNKSRKMGAVIAFTYELLHQLIEKGDSFGMEVQLHPVIPGGLYPHVEAAYHIIEDE
jgi:hypothetical protein